MKTQTIKLLTLFSPLTVKRREAHEELQRYLGFWAGMEKIEEHVHFNHNNLDDAYHTLLKAYDMEELVYVDKNHEIAAKCDFLRIALMQATIAAQSDIKMIYVDADILMTGSLNHDMGEADFLCNVDRWAPSYKAKYHDKVANSFMVANVKSLPVLDRLIEMMDRRSYESRHNGRKPMWSMYGPQLINRVCRSSCYDIHKVHGLTYISDKDASDLNVNKVSYKTLFDAYERRWSEEGVTTQAFNTSFSNYDKCENPVAWIREFVLQWEDYKSRKSDTKEVQST